VQAMETSEFCPGSITSGASIHYRPNTFRWERQHLPPVPQFILAIDYSGRVGDAKRVFRAVFMHKLYLREFKDGRYRSLSAFKRIEGRPL
jgi:hypothetical protein